MDGHNEAKNESGPMTQLFPASNASSAALTHLGREPRVSWFTYAYPAGEKCVRKNVDFPRPGKPTKITISSWGSGGKMAVIRESRGSETRA